MGIGPSCLALGPLIIGVEQAGVTLSNGVGGDGSLPEAARRYGGHLQAVATHSILLP